MADFEELRLQVTFVDNASPQLDMIKRKLEELGGGAQLNNIESLRKKTQEFDEQLKRLLDTVLKGPEAWLKYAAALGTTGVAVYGVGTAVETLYKALDRMATKMLEL